MISIVMPAWNEEKYIAESLTALLAAVRRAEACGYGCEVIVVDNASTDATVERARAFPVRIVREEVRRIATARNAGARAAGGRVLAFIDADSRASDNSLVRIVETLDSGRFIGGGVKVRFERWTLRAALAYGGLPVAMRVLGLSAGMVFTTSDVFRALGGFDERLFAGEDLQFLRALRRHGAKCGKKFANLSDVYVITSIRKVGNMRFKDWLLYPRFLIDRNAARRRENCALWYDARYR